MSENIEFEELPQRLKPKQVILVRKDLKMKPGKMGSQIAHASMKVFFDRMQNEVHALANFEVDLLPKGDLKIRMTRDMWEWKQGEFTKVILAVDSEEELLILYAKASGRGIPSALIEDNGHTVFHGQKTFTTCAIGPHSAEEINAITGHLKLLS